MTPRPSIKAVRRLIAIAIAVATVSLVSAGPLGAQTGNEKNKLPPSSPSRLTEESRAKIAELHTRIKRLREQGRYAEAMTPARELLEIHTRLQGISHLETVAARLRVDLFKEIATLPEEGQRALGLTNSEEWRAIALQKKAAYREAEKIHRAVLETTRHWLGEDHRETAAIYNNLAANLGYQGRYRDGEPLYRKALEIWRKALGENHPDTARAYNNLGLNLDSQGRLAEAMPLLQKALEIWRKTLGEDHPDTAIAYNNLALNLNRQGRYAEAMPLYQKALDIRRKVLGEAQPDTASVYNNLALNLNSQARYADAEPLQRKALEIWRKALGEDHPETGSGYHNLALNLEYQGRYTDAMPLYQKALDIWRKTLGEDHPETAQAYNNLAINLDHRGRYAEARALHQKALEIRRKVSGEDHSDTAHAYNSLAVNLDRQGRHSDAEPLYRKALDIWRKVLGEEHPETAQAYNDLAVNLEDQRRHADAQRLFQKALDIFRKVVGEDHPDTAAAYANLAFTLYALGRIPEAITNWTAAAKSVERGGRAMSSSGLGRSQAGRIEPMPGLAIALASNGQAREAWRFWESGLGRGLLDDISARRLRPLTTSERAREAKLLAEIQQLDERIGVLAERRNSGAQTAVRLDHLRQQRDPLRGQLVEFEQLIEVQYGAFGGKRASLEEIQAILPPDTALVGWVDVRNRNRSVSLHWACLVGAQGDPIWVQVPGSGADGVWTDPDDRRTDELRAALLGGWPTWRSLAAQVGQQRLAPLKPHLSRLRRLIVLPSPDLAGIPLDILLAAWKDGPPLVVSHAPSGTLFAQVANAGAGRPCTTKFLAVGDPLYDSPSAPRSNASGPAEGVLITEVEFPKGLRGGLEPHDVLLTYDGQEILNLKQFKQVLGGIDAKRKALPTGQSFKPTVTILRDGKTRSFVLAPHFVKITYKSWRASSLPSVSLIPRLPGTRREVLAIASLFPAAEATTLLGAQATEAAVQRLATSGELARFRFLHFATHGAVDLDVAMSSALILGTGDGGGSPSESSVSAVSSDGRITAEQILNTWTLDADMVVFSACETGLGRRAGGEGYLGFAQALFIKGARSLVLSQWAVDDAATSLLMVRFYQNLLGKRPGLSKPLPKAESLDEAKRWLRNLSLDEVLAELNALPQRVPAQPSATPGDSTAAKPPKQPAPTGPTPFAHPRFWAAFMLIGDPN